MKIIFVDNLVLAYFLRRPNRFIVFVDYNEEELRCHLPNPGRMTELLKPHCQLFIKFTSNPKRKTRASVVAVKHENQIIQLDSNAISKILPVLIENNRIPFLEKYTLLKREPRYGHHRFDLLLQHPKNKKDVIVELKSTTRIEQSIACFPDAVSTRASNHLQELVRLAENTECFIIFAIFSKAEGFKPCKTIDEKFAYHFENAKNSKLQIHALQFETTIVNSANTLSLALEFLNELPIL